MDLGVSYNFSPQFSGYKSVFSKNLDKALKKTDLSQTDCGELISYVQTFIDKKTRANRRLGRGFHNSVYKIDDKYVLKMPNKISESDICTIRLNRKSKFSKLKNYFGESVAEFLNSSGDNIKILRNVYSKGEVVPAGIPSKISEIMTQDAAVKYYNEKYLPLFASIGQRAFDKLAKDCVQLNKKCKNGVSYAFDYINPNNFVLAGKTIRSVDDIYETKDYVRNCTSDLINVFLMNMNIDFYAQYSPKLINVRSLLAKKIILAGVRHELPLYDGADGRYSMKMLFELFLEKCRHGSEFDDMIKSLKTIMKGNNNPKQRVALAKEYLEEVVGL